MTNTFFTFPNNIVRNTLGRAETLAQIFASVEDGFDLLPDETELRYLAHMLLTDMSGAANQITASFATAPSAYTELPVLFVIAANAPTAATTIDVNSLGSIQVRRHDDAVILANDWAAGSLLILIRDTATGRYRLASAHGADIIATAADAAATAADAVQTALDRIATAADAVSTAADAVATGNDAAATAADLVLTNADVVSTAADATQTALDVIATNADVVSTGDDATATAADVVQTALDRIATAADAVNTDIDATETAADAIATAADVIAAAASAATAAGIFGNAGIQYSVIDRGLTAPPGSPTEGDIYIPAATATGAWATHENEIAMYVSGAWVFTAPQEGWVAWINDEDIEVRWNTSAWAEVVATGTGDNAIINPTGRVQQRGDLTLVKDAYGFGPDRFQGMATGTVVSAGVLTAVSNASVGVSGYAHKFSGVTLTGTGILYHRQRISALISGDYKNQAAVLTVKVYHDVGSAKTFTLFVRKANSADDFSAVTAIGNDGGTSVNSATATTLTFLIADMGDCSNGIELELKAEVGAITNKNLDITEWKLEPGSVSTAFRPRLYDEELTLCLPYFERQVLKNISGIGHTTSAGAVTGSLRMARKRKDPNSILIPSAGSGFTFLTVPGALPPTYGSMAVTIAGKNGYRLSQTGASGFTTGSSSLFQASGAGINIDIDSEL